MTARRAAASVATAALLLTAGCTAQPTPAPEAGAPPAQHPTEPRPAAEVLPAEPLLTGNQLQEFRQRFGDRASLAVMPLDGGDPVAVVGHGQPYAWSTIKVLIAGTVTAESGGPQGLTAEQRSRIRAALSVSDNAAAASLHAQLVQQHGGVGGAAEAMTAVLRGAGDASTVVQTLPRAGFSSYGQTLWGVGEQARFAGSLYRGCLYDERSTAFLLDEMGHVAPDQRWGLGRTGASGFKGGWGPDPDGTFLVRQFGFATAPDGNPYAVVLAVRSSDGTFTSATRMVSGMAEWVQSAVPAAPPVAPCGPAPGREPG